MSATDGWTAELRVHHGQRAHHCRNGEEINVECKYKIADADVRLGTECIEQVHFDSRTEMRCYARELTMVGWLSDKDANPAVSSFPIRKGAYTRPSCPAAPP